MSKLSLEVFSKDVPSEVLDQQCSDKFLADVAGKIVSWETLAPYFNIDRGEKRSIKADCYLYDEQKQEFLYKWKEKNPGRATNRALLEAIHDCNEMDLLHHACQLLQHKSYEAKDNTAGLSNVSPLLLKYRNNLKYKYRAHKPVMMTEWPPPCSLGYVKLVLVPKEPIKRGEITSKDIYTKMRQSYEEEMDTSEEVEIETLLELSENERKVILFEGPPGSGKSTLLWHICQIWESGQQFQQYSIVLLVQMRDPAYRKANSLAGLVPSEEIASEIKAVNGEGVLLLLDGWDEAPIELCQEYSFFHDLIAKPSNFSIEMAVIVVSSRPLITDNIWMHLSDRIELRGFTKEMREKYIRESLTGDPEGAKSLIDKIDGVEEVDAIDLSLPINVVSLIHIFSTTSGELPPTPCRIAIQVVLSIILRHLKKKTHRSIHILKSFEDLPHPAGDWFNGICKLAYDGIANEKYSFTSEDLASLTSNVLPVPEDGVTTEDMMLSILLPVYSLVAEGTVVHYHFLHLLHQEFCAAYYISKLPNAEAHKDAFKPLLRIHKYRNFCTFQSVCKFYAALTSLEMPSVAGTLKFCLIYGEKMVEYSSDESDSEADNESGIQSSDESFHESSEDEVRWKSRALLCANNIASCNREWYDDSFVHEFAVESRNIKFVDKFMGVEGKFHIRHDTERTFAAFVSMSTSVESLTYYLHSNSHRVIKALENKPHLKDFAVFVFYRVIDCAIFETLGTALATCPALEHVVMIACFSESVPDIDVLTKLFKNRNISTIEIDSQSSIEDTRFATLAPAFLNKKSIKIQCREVGPLGLQKLSSLVLESKALGNIELIMEKYGGRDKEMFGSLSKSPSMRSILLSCMTKELTVADSEVGKVLLSGNLCELAEIFGMNHSSTVTDRTLHIHIFGSCLKICLIDRYFKSVSYVDCLHHRHHFVIEVKDQIGLEGVSRICEGLQTVPVKELNLTAQSIGDRGAILLAESTPVCLGKLVLRQCNIGKDGIKSLFSRLGNNKTLVNLDIAFNNFGDCGAIVIAELINQTSLEVLDVDECGIGEEGMMAIANALRTNTLLRDISLYNKCQPITQRSEEEFSKLLIQNRILSRLRVNQSHEFLRLRFFKFAISLQQHFKISLKSMQSLKEDFGENELYLGLKLSPIIRSIELEDGSALAQGLADENIELAADLLQLKGPPKGIGGLTLHMSNGTVWNVDYYSARIKRQRL